MAVTTPTGISIGREEGPRQHIARDEKRRAKERRRRQHDPVVDADQQSDQVRHDDADEPDRPRQRDGGGRGQRCAEERQPLRARHVHTACGRGILAHAEQVERRGQQREQRECGDDERQRTR